MTPLLVGLLSLLVMRASPAETPAATADCVQVCQRHVSQPYLRARICSRCPARSGEDRGAWAVDLARVRPFPSDAVRSALQDPDWMVRWGAVRARALAEHARDSVALANWVASAKPNERALSALTAARVAASRHEHPEDLLGTAGAQGPKALERVAAYRDGIRRVLENELYQPSLVVSQEALAHLSQLHDITPVRALLNAMARRPASTDVASAALLRRLALGQHLGVGAVVAQLTRKEDKPLVQRLSAVYAQDLEPWRRALADQDPHQRLTAVEAMVPYLPLSREDLEDAVLDPDDAVQLAAARALAQGAGQSLEAYARVLLAPKGAEDEVQLAWLGAVAQAAEPGCAALLVQAGQNAQLPEGVRAAAYEDLPRCQDPEGMTRLRTGLADPSPAIRAASVHALGRLPRSPSVDAALDAAMDAHEPPVLLAAVESVVAQGTNAHVRAVGNLLLNTDPQVRKAAALALGPLGSQAQVKGLVGRLRLDDVPAVRVAAAQSLGVLGGPVAVSTLGAAAERDPDATVRDAAGQSLRKLGFAR